MAFCIASWCASLPCTLLSMHPKLYRTCCIRIGQEIAIKYISKYIKIDREKKTYMIPPALMKICKPVSKRNFDQFKGCTYYPCHFYVSNHYHFEPPSRKMCDEVNIKYCLVYIVHAWNWVLWRENPAVFCVISFRKRIAKWWMKKFECFSGLISRQQQYESHKGWVAEEDTQNCSPIHWMWSPYMSIRELSYTEGS